MYCCDGMCCCSSSAISVSDLSDLSDLSDDDFFISTPPLPTQVLEIEYDSDLPSPSISHIQGMEIGDDGVIIFHNNIEYRILSPHEIGLLSDGEEDINSDIDYTPMD